MVLRKLRNFIRNRRVFVAALLLAVAAVIAWQFGPAIQAIVRDQWIGELAKLGVEMIPYAKLYGADIGSNLLLWTAGW